jgi:hypothetical protein
MGFFCAGMGYILGVPAYRKPNATLRSWNF